MNNKNEIEMDFIRIRQERINEIVEATLAGHEVGNIDLTYIEKMTEAKTSEVNLFDLLDELKENTTNEQEKEIIVAEFEKLVESEKNDNKKEA